MNSPNLLSVKDKPLFADPHFSIVKIKGLSLQDAHSSVCVDRFHKAMVVDSRPDVRRRITRDAGMGLEKLGHALEYLTDEFVHDGCRFAEDHGRLQAIQLLASLNRQIYFACDVEPTLRESVQALFRRLFGLANLSN